MGSCLPVVPKEQGEHPWFSLEQLQARGGERPEPPLRTSNLGRMGNNRDSHVVVGFLLTLLVFDVQVLAALNLSLTHIWEDYGKPV